MKQGKIQFNSISLRRGTKELFIQASAAIDAGNRVGLVGRNGAGKTSLFKLMMGELHEEAGEVVMPKSWSIAYLEQALPDTDQQAFAYVRAGDKVWVDLQAQIKQAEQDNDGMKLANCYAELEAIDGYRIDSRVAILLRGLGFAQSGFEQTVKSYSGGWQMRLQLARVLMSRSDCMLLDEPTNHLDLETIMWLENWLKSHKGTMLVISHDRDFLDSITTQTLYLASQKLRLFQGNYSSFSRQFSEALVLQEKSNSKIIKQRQHLQSFVDRFRAKATKAKQAQGRIKAIEKLQLSTGLQQEQGVSIQFLSSSATGYPTLSLRADLGYGDKVILNQVNLNVGDGDRIGVIGINGSGKSTLLKSIAQELKTVSGEITFHPKAKIGYFSQEQLNMLHLDESPLAHLRQQHPRISESEARRYLGGFGFSDARVFEPVSIFSGGERARLALALLIKHAPNVLVLDEPTNHLDMHMREALSLALQDFSGAVLLVSHDRHFLECCVNELWLVKHQSVQCYEGSLSDYERDSLMEKETLQTTNSAVNPQASISGKAKKQLNQLEKEIDKLQRQLSGVEAALADPDLYERGDQASIDKLTTKLRSIQDKVRDREQQWLELSEKS